VKNWFQSSAFKFNLYRYGVLIHAKKYLTTPPANPPPPGCEVVTHPSDPKDYAMLSSPEDFAAVGRCTLTPPDP
jgi:hypothetical protein